MARSSPAATALGSAAILLWSTLAALTTWTEGLPTFELVAIAFFIGFLIALVKWIARGERPLAHMSQSPAAWAVGIGGLFGFHVLYFIALRQAPVAEANLINYLWPILLVAFGALLPGERLRFHQLAGAAIGFAGAALLLLLGRDGAFGRGHAIGYAAALGCALCWAGYSVLSRRLKAVPTDAVGGFCLGTAGLAALCHAAFESFVWPVGAQWLVVLVIGLGPVGAAFYLWDIGVKQGDIGLLGAAAYATPLLSTLLLVAAGRVELTATVALAAALIAGSGALAGRDLWWRRARRRVGAA